MRNKPIIKYDIYARLNKLKPNVVLLLALGLTTVQGQEDVILSTGGDATGNGGYVNYSIGQLVYTTTGQHGTVAQGIQQPYEILIATSIAKVEGTNLMASIYPNPTNSHLILEIEGEQHSRCIAALYDSNGKLVKNTYIKGLQTILDIHDLSTGTYFLKIFRKKPAIKTKKAFSQQEILTFEVLKN